METPKPKSKRRKLILAIAGGLLVSCVLCVIIVSLSGSPNKATPTPALSLAESTKPAATTTPAETSTPAPTDTPAPTPVPTEPPKPVVLQGSGQTATDAIQLPATISVAQFTHTGSGNFIVQLYIGNEQDLLINTIGNYKGARPIAAEEPIMFDIQADGAWTITITPLQGGGAPEFSGRGDGVSALFDPPARGAWLIKHDGESNFVVYCHCAGGSDMVQNEIGTVDGSRVVSFGEGPCFWEVEADGNWSLAPK